MAQGVKVPAAKPEYLGPILRPGMIKKTEQTNTGCPLIFSYVHMCAHTHTYTQNKETIIKVHLAAFFRKGSEDTFHTAHL